MTKKAGDLGKAEQEITVPPKSRYQLRLGASHHFYYSTKATQCKQVLESRGLGLLLASV